MGQSLDLGKLKKEIHSRKTKTGQIIDDGRSSTEAAKDGFLNGLVESLNSGRPTQASETVKEIDRLAKNKEITKNGGVPIPKTSNYVPPENNNIPVPNGKGLADAISENTHIPTRQTQNQAQNPIADREAELYKEFERKKKALYLQPNDHESNTHQLPSQLNENQITEVINDKFSVIVEQAMKDSIVEIYAASRMRETIVESRDLIREVVIEVIRELQTKNKKK